MATWADLQKAAGELPGLQLVGEAPGRKVICAGQTLAWERPYTKADIKRETAAGADIYEGTIVAFHTPDPETAAAYVHMEPTKFFLTQHFGNYPAVLTRFEHLTLEDLRELLYEAHLARVVDRGRA